MLVLVLLVIQNFIHLLRNYNIYTMVKFNATTTGKIVSVNRLESSGSTGTRVDFDYKIDDQLYKSYFIVGGSKQEEIVREKYPVNKIVKVNYDSTNPQAAALFVNNVFPKIWLLLISIILLGLLSIWLFSSKKRDKKYNIL